MSTAQQRGIIIAYWHRIFVSSKTSFDDIANIMIEYGDPYEIFDASISHQDVRFLDDNCRMAKFLSYGAHTYGLIEI